MRIAKWLGLLIVVLCTGNLLAQEPEDGLPVSLKNFVTAKAKQIRRSAERTGLEVNPEVQNYLKAAESGDWMQAMGSYDAVRNSWSNSEEPDERRLEAVSSAAVLELQLAFEQIMDGDTDTALALKLGDAILSSVPRGAIYFGGTDPGRGLPTALSKSHENGDPFFTITQRALADGRYMVYLREMYGRSISLPSTEDVSKAFQDYMADAQRRLEHDQEHPNEPRQLKPGEEVRMSKGKVQVSGHVAVMSINALLARMIFDRNADREFCIEESFPLDWMYPHLSPQGMILKIHREPLKEITAAEVEKDAVYWGRQQRPLIGEWLTSETSLEDVCQFVRKRYIDRNMGGFEGNEKFLQSDKLQKTYAKMRSAIGGVYAWRASQAKDARTRERMTRAADAAFKQSFAFGPTSSETVFRYVNLLMDGKRFADALRLANLAADLDPGNGAMDRLIKAIESQIPAPKSP